MSSDAERFQRVLGAANEPIVLAIQELNQEIRSHLETTRTHGRHDKSTPTAYVLHVIGSRREIEPKKSTEGRGDDEIDIDISLRVTRLIDRDLLAEILNIKTLSKNQITGSGEDGAASFSVPVGVKGNSSRVSKPRRKRAARMWTGKKFNGPLPIKTERRIGRYREVFKTRKEDTKKNHQRRMRLVDMIELLAHGFDLPDDSRELETVRKVIGNAQHIRYREDPLYKTFKDAMVEQSTEVHTGCADCRRTETKQANKRTLEQNTIMEDANDIYRRFVVSFIHVPLGLFVVDLISEDFQSISEIENGSSSNQFP